MIIYIHDDAPNKFRKPSYIEGLCIELNFRKDKLLLLRMYHPPSQPDDQYYSNNLGRYLDKYSNFQKVLLLKDRSLFNFIPLST